MSARLPSPPTTFSEALKPLPQRHLETIHPHPSHTLMATDGGSILPYSSCSMAPSWIRLKRGFSSNHVPACLFLLHFPLSLNLFVSPESQNPYLRIYSEEPDLRHPFCRLEHLTLEMLHSRNVSRAVPVPLYHSPTSRPQQP